MIAGYFVVNIIMIFFEPLKTLIFVKNIIFTVHMLKINVGTYSLHNNTRFHILAFDGKYRDY